ncbi:MAG TPA: hypothetical protein PLZ51_04805 [Aggregatilineales bacterium]|nr:hypothetical protein [Aggregatilineales bacterium]
MTLSVMPMTVEEFDQYALSPENSDKILEFIVGHIHEKPINPCLNVLFVG